MQRHAPFTLLQQGNAGEPVESFGLACLSPSSAAALAIGELHREGRLARPDAGGGAFSHHHVLGRTLLGGRGRTEVALSSHRWSSDPKCSHLRHHLGRIELIYQIGYWDFWGTLSTACKLYRCMRYICLYTQATLF